MGLVSTQCECDRCLRPGEGLKGDLHPEGWNTYYLYMPRNEQSRNVLLCVECQKDLRRWFADRGSITL